MATTTTTKEKEKRITKSQRYADIIAILSGQETIPNGSTVEDLKTFAKDEIERLKKRNSTERKPTKNQLENEEHKEKILEIMADGKDFSCSDMRTALKEMDLDFSPQKVYALLKQLGDEGKIANVEEKGKSLWAIC